MATHQMVLKKRLQKEITQLVTEPTDGIVCYPKDDSLSVLRAYIGGPAGTPYHGGNFPVELEIPEKYPFSPPIAKFTCKVYHPNIDSQGRVCLDMLKASSWSPSWTLKEVFLSLRNLLEMPNYSDPLVPEIAKECATDPERFKKIAKEWTQLYASSGAIGPSGEGPN